MADISDVEQAVLSLLTQTAYPNGTSSPSAVLDSGGNPHNVQLYRGWPVSEQINADMRGGTVDVSIFPTPVEKNVTRYNEDFEDLLYPAPTLTLSIGSGRLQLDDSSFFLLEGGGYLLLGTDIEVTVGGTVSVPQNVGAIINGIGYVYAVQSNDTLASIATGLAALINFDTPATASGNVITIPAMHAIIPRIGVVGTAIQELARQDRNIQITIWCPSPDLRDNAGKLFDVALKKNHFIATADGTECRLMYVRSPVTDFSEKENVYRRDLIYAVEFPTTNTIPAPTVTIVVVNLNSQELLEDNNAGGFELEDGSGDLVLEGNSIYI